MERRNIVGGFSTALAAAGCSAMATGAINANALLVTLGAVGLTLGVIGVVVLFFTAPRKTPVDTTQPAAIHIKNARKVRLEGNRYKGRLYESDETKELHAKANEHIAGE